MRNTQILSRVAPCLAILTLATFALPSASYAAVCHATSATGGPDVPEMAGGTCPPNYVKLQNEDPRAIAPADNAGGGATTGASNGDGAAPGGTTAPATAMARRAARMAAPASDRSEIRRG